jgi:hypothetical protein
MIERHTSRKIVPMTHKSAQIGHCGLCPRVVSEPELDLTKMWKPGIDQPLRICNDPACWKSAEDQGYRLQADLAHESDAT